MRKKMFIAVTLLATLLAGAQSRWQGRRAAIIGDSISDSCRVGTDKCWWQMLSDSLGLQPLCYARNGATILDMQGQLERALQENPSWDLLIIFGGTNDFNGSVPMGDTYTVAQEQTDKDGQPSTLIHRTFNTDNATFCGRLNNLLSAVKRSLPDAQVVVLTPVHRGRAAFGSQNVQPDELWANRQGLFLDDYLAAISRAGRAWAVPVFDLNAACQFFPLYGSYNHTVHDINTDRLHPGTEGHRRMALAVQGYLEHIIPFTSCP